MKPRAACMAAPGPRGRKALEGARASPRVPLVLVLALVAAGCAARNYRDPLGPRYAGRHAEAPPPGDDLRIVTFNIAHAKRIREAIGILRAHAPLRDFDALALQEMDASGTEAIARALGLDYVYYPASNGPRDGRDMGEAVLSPWPIEDSWKVLLPHVTRVLHRSRAAVAARLCVDGRRVTVYSVHFGSPWGMGGGGRRDQARAVLADAQQQAGPVVIAGDFNSRSVSRVFEAAGFVWATRDVGHTAGPFSFDHVVARGLAPVAGRAAGVVRAAREASDHRPVWARFELHD